MISLHILCTYTYKHACYKDIQLMVNLHTLQIILADTIPSNWGYAFTTSHAGIGVNILSLI
jgi:hypothetical protein